MSLTFCYRCHRFAKNNIFQWLCGHPSERTCANLGKKMLLLKKPNVSCAHKRQAIGLDCLHKNAQLFTVSQSIGVRVRTIKFLQKTVIAEKTNIRKAYPT